MAKANGKVVMFSMDKETKNTVKFKEEAGDGPEVIGALYIRKEAVAELGGPRAVKVTIEAQ